MWDHNVSLLAVQEPKLYPNDMPTDLFKSTYFKLGTTSGTRGHLWVVHPNWKNNVRLWPDLGANDPNILWVQVKCDHTEWLAASV